MNTHTTQEALEGNGEPGKARSRTYIISVQSPGEHDKGSAGVRLRGSQEVKASELSYLKIITSPRMI